MFNTSHSGCGANCSDPHRGGSQPQTRRAGRSCPRCQNRNARRSPGRTTAVPRDIGFCGACNSNKEWRTQNAERNVASLALSGVLHSNFYILRLERGGTNEACYQMAVRKDSQSVALSQELQTRSCHSNPAGEIAVHLPPGRVRTKTKNRNI